MHVSIKDYGAFYQDDLFKTTLYPNFAAGHEKGARDLVDKLLKQCNAITDLPRITTVVDIGCGEGTLLAEIKQYLDRLKGDPDQCEEDVPTVTRWIGLDCSEKAISQAKTRYSDVRIEFLHNTQDADWPSLFQSLQVDWSATALTCLSHSWFHIQNEHRLRNAITLFRPALLVIDLWHSCDATVAKARNETAFEEPIHTGTLDEKPGIYVLRTEKREETLVRRGICFREATGEPDWLFETIQRLEDTSTLFGSPEELSDLNTALLAGSITGANGCDYIMARKFRHPSGWGEMVCHALVPRDPIGKALNTEYFAVLRQTPKRLFVEEEGKKPFGHLRKLLAAFDEVDPTVERKASQMYGDREVTVVLPFDPQRCFARALSLFPTLDDQKISAYDFILEDPNNFQLRFPTGYGHFQTLLSRVSSQQAFPLSWAYNYERSKVDEEYDKLETPNLCFREKATETSHWRGPESTTKPAFFLLPVYWGSLPLFVLVLKFPPRFPIESTDAQVYQSTLQNLHRQIKLIFTESFLTNDIISPFLSRCLDALHQLFNPPHKHAQEGISRPGDCEYCGCVQCNTEGISTHLGTGSAGACERIEFYLNLIRERLDGRKRWDAEFEENHIALGGVLGGRWKSWLLTIPSIPIKQLESTKTENRVLIRLFREEAKRALLNHELRISYWFQEGGFFDGQAHEQWREDVHPGLLRQMFTLAGVPNGRAPENQIDDLAYSGYFTRSETHYLMAWTQGVLRVLFNPGSTPEQKQSTFEDLKATFCKTWENKGEGMRFSWRRLWVHLDAAKASDGVPITPRLIIAPELHHHTWHKHNNGPDSRYFCHQDPTHVLGEMCNALAAMDALSSVKILLSGWTTVAAKATATGTGTLTFFLKHALRKEIGGANCMRLRHHAGILWRRYNIPANIDHWLYGRDALQLRLDIKQIDHALTFTVTPHISDDT